MTTLLNPFSVSLKKHPFMYVGSEPVFENGDYKIYKNSINHFVYTYKNLVISERAGLNKRIIDDLVNNQFTGKEKCKALEFNSPQRALKQAIEAAKSLNFEIK